MKELKWYRGNDPLPLLPTYTLPGVSARKARWFVLDHLEEIQGTRKNFRLASRLVISADESGKLTAEIQSRSGKKSYPVFLEEDFY